MLAVSFGAGFVEDPLNGWLHAQLATVGPADQRIARVTSALRAYARAATRNLVNRRGTDV